MIRCFEDTGRDLFWTIELPDDEAPIVIRSGTRGTPGEETYVTDSWEAHGVPPSVLFDDLVLKKRREGFAEVLPPDLLARIEGCHRVSLRGRLRAFYETRAYESLQGKTCRKLGCAVDLASRAVQGSFHQKYVDRNTHAEVKLVPIASKIIDGREDEQQWIGMNPALEDGPVYELFTSGDYELAYPSLDAFLGDLGDG
jgi:hypothetical protein